MASDPSAAVVEAARRLSDAVADHAEVLAEVATSRTAASFSDGPTADEVSAVIAAGGALREAVLLYEEALWEHTGWSNPIRHLGRLPVFDARAMVEADGRPLVRVVAEYLLAIEDEIGVTHLAEGSGGPPEADLVEALRYLVEKDGWDPWRYGPGRFDVAGASVVATREETAEGE